MGLFSRLGPKAAPEKTPEQLDAERKAAEAAANPPPAGVSRAELDQILGQRFDAMLGQLSQIAGRPVQVQLPTPQPAVVPEPEISDAELEQALLQGTNSGAMVRRLVQTEARKLANVLIRDHIDPLRETGTAAISELVARDAATALPFYRHFKDKIDAMMAQLAPEQRINPGALKLVHDNVVGENWKEVAEIVAEQKVREAAESGAHGNTPGGGTPRVVSHDEPSIEDFGGRAAIQALRYKDGGAQDLDTFARKLGYKSFKEYAAIMPDLEAQYKQ